MAKGSIEKKAKGFFYYAAAAAVGVVVVSPFVTMAYTKIRTLMGV